VLMYRSEGATDFTEVRMQKSGCKFTGSIPATGMKGSVVHYYVAAMNDKGKPIAAKGSAGSPNIMELTAAPAGGVAKDDEDPINGHKAAPKRTADVSPVVVATPPAGEVSGGTSVGFAPKQPKVMLLLMGGSGFGYLSTSYMTEALNPVHSAGFSNPNAVVMPELGFYVMPQLTISAVARLEVPVGANVEGHATLGPAGLLRARYALKPTGEGLRLMLQGGFGIMRSTIKLDNNAPGMDTDVVAQGPLLLGGGAGYWHKVSGSASFVVELSVIDGIATQSHLGTAPHLNGGLDADMSLGIALGF
jgi:hypothetical protein